MIFNENQKRIVYKPRETLKNIKKFNFNDFSKFKTT